MEPRSSFEGPCPNQGLFQHIYKQSGKMEERNTVVIKTAGGTDFEGLERPKHLKKSRKLGSASSSAQKGQGGRGCRYEAGQRGGKPK